MTSEALGVVLEVENLYKSFGGVSAVTDVTMRLAPRELIVLIGPNGAGKTTIFNLITGATRPDRGRVLLDGRDITSLPSHRRAILGIGRSFQDVRLFSGMTVSENVEVYAQPPSATSTLLPFGLPRRTNRRDRAARSRSATVLEQLGIARLSNRMVDDLSYAQQKLVAIGRLLALGARVLLLDEPASGLDEAGREQLCQVVEQLAADGLTVCVVEHNLDVVRRLATQLIFLADGQVLAHGSPETIFASSELADVYFGTGALA